MDGNKVFIFYEGDHDKLDRQIRSGIASIVIYKLMYGDNWKELYKYAIDQGLKFLSFGDAVLFEYK